MVAGSRGIRRPSSTPQDAARPRSWPHRLRRRAGLRLAPSGDAVGGVVAFVVCAYRARLLRDDAFDVFLTQRGAQQRRPVDRHAQSIVATISPYGLSISSEWTALRSAMVAGTGSGFGSATGFVEADSALRGASPKGMRGELFITCLLGDFLSKIPGQFVLVSTSFGSGDNPSGDKLSFIGSGLPSPSASASRFRGFSSMFSVEWSPSMTTSHSASGVPWRSACGCAEPSFAGGDSSLFTRAASLPSAKSDGSPFIRYGQTRSACCQWREPFAFPAADDFDCPISAASPRQDRPCCAAKMKNKNTWSIPDIAALADYFGVPVTSLLDDTLMRQMLGEGNLGASLVAATTARFPVRAAEGQADGLKPLETKGSGPRYLVEPGAGEYPQRDRHSRGP